jgi:hypothetical protein
MRRKPLLEALAPRADRLPGATHPTASPPGDCAHFRSTTAAAKAAPSWKRRDVDNCVTHTPGRPGCLSRRERRRAEQSDDEHHG